MSYTALINKVYIDLEVSLALNSFEMFVFVDPKTVYLKLTLNYVFAPYRDIYTNIIDFTKLASVSDKSKILVTDAYHS